MKEKVNEKMYALLDSVQKTAGQMGQTASSVSYLAGKTAGSLLSAAKLNMRIAERRRAVGDAFREVGEILYATHTGSPTESEVLLEKLQGIDALKAEIAELEIQAGKASLIHTCPTCGAETQEGDVYCRECGEKL